MDLSFNSRMEAYYQKFIELQDKLRNSEEERLRLEMKFNEMVQVAKDEEQMHYKKLRSQYKRFLEEDKKRQERNEKIIRNLERVETRISMLTSKSERFKMLRRQYQSYLQRIARSKPSDKRENQSAPRIVIDAPYTSNMNKKIGDEDDVNTSSQTNDEKLEMLDRYLQSLSSQKPIETLDVGERTPHADLKYLNDISKKLEKGFDSNEANSIAEDIMNSIYSRHYKKETADSDSVKTNFIPNYSSSNNVGKKISHVGEYNKRGNSSVADRSPSPNKRNVSLGAPVEANKVSANDFTQKMDYYGDNRGRGYQFMHSNNALPVPTTTNEILNTTHVPNNTTLKGDILDVNTPLKGGIIDFNKSGPACFPVSYIRDNDNAFIVNQNSPQDSIGLHKGKKTVEDSADNELSIDSLKIKEDLGIQQGNSISRDQNVDSKSDFSLSKSEIDVIENEKELEKEKCTVEEDKDEDKYIERDNIEVTKQVEDNVQSKESSENSESEIIPKTHHDNQMPTVTEQDYKQLTTTQKEIESPEEEKYDTQGYITKISEITVPAQEEVQLQRVIDTNECNEDKLFSEEKENKAHISQPELEEVQNGEKVGSSGSNQVGQYDQSGQQEQFISENTPQYGDIQYDENQEQGMYYENGQPQQYTDDDQNVQQYYDNGQTELYEQQSNDNQAAQYYEQNGEYQTNAQDINPYDQQYDENGQPLYQYDENGQVIQQYDENGQPIIYNQPMQYSENVQPNLQHDENGQPIEVYGENQAEYPEYQAEFQQYDETGQSGYQYNSNAVPQYDEHGQPLFQDELNQEYGGTDGQYQEYHEGAQEPDQVEENCDVPQEYIETSQPEFQLPKNNEEIVENVQETELSEKDKLRDESSAESIKNIDGVEQQDYVAEESVKNVQKAKNVLDMLDTDTESLKQNTSKISNNDSDFDFSNS